MTAPSSSIAICSSLRRPTPADDRSARTRAASRASSACWIRTLVFPNYDRNGMYLSTGNVLLNQHVGMLFIDFERGRRLRLEARRSLPEEAPCLAQGENHVVKEVAAPNDLVTRPVPVMGLKQKQLPGRNAWKPRPPLGCQKLTEEPQV